MTSSPTVPAFTLTRPKDAPLDPSPLYTELRAKQPISRVSLWEGQLNPRLVTRWEDARTVRRHDELRIAEGSLEERKFTAVYRTGDRLTGVLSVGMPPKSTRAWRSSIALRARWQDAVPEPSLGVTA